MRQLNKDGDDDCHEPKASESQLEIQHIEAGNKGTEKVQKILFAKLMGN